MREIGRTVTVTEYEYDEESNVTKETSTTVEYEPAPIHYNVTYGYNPFPKTWGSGGNGGTSGTHYQGPS